MQAEATQKLDGLSFDRLLNQVEPEAGDGTFDLRGLRLITPAALVQLASTCHSRARDGHHATIAVDEGPVRSYLLRSGFVQAVDQVASFEPGIGSFATMHYSLRRGSNPMLVEVTRIESGASLPTLLDSIVWALRYRLRYQKRDAFDVTVAISEICQNTFDHNTGTCGFLAMQVYGKDPAARFLEIGVSDHGAGLTATLSRNPKNGAIASDLEAIELATHLGTSQHDDPTRGTGLYHLLETTYQHRGSVHIRSGNAMLRFRMDQKRAWSMRVVPVPGVHVALSLPAKTRG